MRQIKVAVLALTAVLALSVASKAVAQTGVTLGVGAGVAIPTGDLGDFAKTGIGGGVGLNIRPNGGQVGIRLGVGYTQFSEDGGSSDDPKLKVMTPMASVTYSFAHSGASVHPYVLAGAGIMRSSFDGTSESAFGFQGGGGLSFGTGSTRFFVEAKYVTASKDGSTTSFMPLGVGVSFKLK